MNVSLGIDPGAEGYFVLLDMETRQLVGSFQIPMTSDSEFDALKAVQLLKDILDPIQGVIVRCNLEQVHAIYGASAKSTFQFGGVFHSLKTFLAMCGIAYKPVPPKSWQKKMWEGIRPMAKAGKLDTKGMSLAAATKLFPTESFLRTTRCKKPDDNFVDAALIAYYACIS